MTRTPVLQLTQVGFSYRRDAEVLSDVSVSLGTEEVVALLGRNGAGKTTLIQLVMGMLAPHRGTVRVFGLDPRRNPVEVKRRIGYVAEGQQFPAGMSVGELLDFHRRVFPTWDTLLEHELLERFSLANPRAKIGALSKGQARQVALTCAIGHRPELLILDEPAGGLDPAARREMLATSMQLLNRDGTSILHSSHYLSEVERFGGRAVILRDGRVGLDHSLDDLREEHCVAVIPHRKRLDAHRIERVPGCLNVRWVPGCWHAVFQGSPSRTRQRLQLALGVADASCTRVSLEELFIELLGGARHTVESEQAIMPAAARPAGVP